jgi:hypothetical protein
MTSGLGEELNQPTGGVSVGDMLLGAASAAGERIIGAEQTALVVGVVADGRDAMAHAFMAMTSSVRRLVPADNVQGAVEHARARGRDAMAAGRDSFASGREQVGEWLRSAAGVPVKWAEQTAIPKVMDDMTPYIADEMMPKLIDAMMPQIRSTVVPAIIEDLTTDPRVRTMIAEQSHGVVAAAADELRQVTSDADDNLESAFRRTFVRRAQA